VGGFGVGVREGVAVSIKVRVGLGVKDGVAEAPMPNGAKRVATASSGLTGVISPWEQKLPVKVQASVSSSGERGSGADGGLIADVPFSPPRSMLVLCPAVTICVCPLDEMDADPLYRLTSIEPF
jgi:hypothetical protein